MAWALVQILGCGLPPEPGEDAGATADAAVEDPCDVDGDGYASTECGGPDCNDANPSFHPGAQDAPWLREVVDGPADLSSFGVGSDSMQGEADGTLHVAYFTAGDFGERVGYASRNAGGWSVETIGDGWYPSLALDRAGDPHVVYASFEGLRYAVRRNGEWLTETIRPGEHRMVDGNSLAAAMDSRGSIHVVATAVESTSLFEVLSNASGSWVSDPIDGAPGRGTAIAVDANGAVHISTVGQSLSYWTNASGEWRQEVVAETAGHFPMSAIMVDPNGAARIAYADDGYLHFASNATGRWVVEDVDTASPGLPIDLVADAAGRTVLAYSDGRQLRVATNEAGRWILSTPDPARGLALGVSLWQGPETTEIVWANSDGNLEHATSTGAAPDDLDQDCNGIADE